MKRAGIRPAMNTYALDWWRSKTSCRAVLRQLGVIEDVAPRAARGLTHGLKRWRERSQTQTWIWRSFRLPSESVRKELASWEGLVKRPARRDDEGHGAPQE